MRQRRLSVELKYSDTELLSCKMVSYLKQAELLVSQAKFMVTRYQVRYYLSRELPSNTGIIFVTCTRCNLAGRDIDGNKCNECNGYHGVAMEYDEYVDFLTRKCIG